VVAREDGSTGSAREPDEGAGPDLDGDCLRLDAAVTGQHNYENVDIWALVQGDDTGRWQMDDVGVQVLFTHLKLPDGARHIWVLPHDRRGGAQQTGKGCRRELGMRIRHCAGPDAS
jgi:hypothetical protein